MVKISPAVKAAEKKTILITGAGSGMGSAAAKELASQGHSVYSAARRVERMAPLTECGVRTIELDVTDEEACKDVAGWVVAKRGRIDALANNAGCGSYGAIEDVEIDEVRHQFDVNVSGLAALVKAAFLHMRERRSGTIVNVLNIGGRLVGFMGGWYHATKHAAEALLDVLRVEAAEFGIGAVLIEPGGIKTKWTDVAADHLAESLKGGAYEQTAVKTAEGMRRQHSGKMMSDPNVVMQAILWAVNAKRPRPRYFVGFGTKPLVAAHAMLPTRAFDWVMKRIVFALSRRKPRRS